MPWTFADAQRHTHQARSAKSKRAFAHAANSVLERTGDEGFAVRAGNAAVNASNEKGAHEMGKHESKNRKRARGMLNRAGYRAGGHVNGATSEAGAIKPATPPKTATVALKSGGKVDGPKSAPRLDRTPRKSGGRVRHKGGKGHHTTNIMIGAPGGGLGGPGAGGGPDPATAFKAGLMKGAQLGAAQAGGGKPPMMPPPGAGPGGPPPGGPPMMPPPGGPQPPMQRGGRIAKKSGGGLTAKMPGGAGGGNGRLAKASYYKAKGKS